MGAIKKDGKPLSATNTRESLLREYADKKDLWRTALYGRPTFQDKQRGTSNA